MTALPERVVPNTNEVAAKILEGEAILINLTTGVYYSMADTGGRIWSLLEEGHTLGDVASTLEAEYDVDRETCERDVQHLVRQMLEENLVLPADGDGADGSTGTPAVEADGRAYSTPELMIYRDMGDLLALDPPVPGLEAVPWDDPETGASGTT